MKNRIVAQVQIENLSNERVIWHVIVQGEVIHSFRTRDDALKFLQAYTGEPPEPRSYKRKPPGLGEQ